MALKMDSKKMLCDLCLYIAVVQKQPRKAYNLVIPKGSMTLYRDTYTSEHEYAVKKTYLGKMNISIEGESGMAEVPFCEDAFSICEELETMSPSEWMALKLDEKGLVGDWVGFIKSLVKDAYGIDLAALDEYLTKMPDWRNE